MKVSIVMTAYNTEKYIAEAINSCINQTYKNIELIIVEDKSTDCTLSIIEEFCKQYPIVLIKHEENLGAGWSRRDGIEQATGDYIITIDSDDTISDIFIETLVNRANETDADIVSGGITIIHEDGFEESKLFPEKISEELDKFKDYNNGKIIFLNNKLVKRYLYNLVPYSTRRYCEDTPVIIPLLYYANKVAYARTTGYYYKQHSESLCHKTDAFEQAVYKGLCCKDVIEFFKDKDKQYKDLITTAKLASYIKQIKQTINDESYSKCIKEFAELMKYAIKLIEI